MKSKFPNHARNVWDRAVALLPRVEQFWYKYSYMEVGIIHLRLFVCFFMSSYLILAAHRELQFCEPLGI